MNYHFLCYPLATVLCVPSFNLSANKVSTSKQGTGGERYILSTNANSEFDLNINGRLMFDFATWQGEAYSGVEQGSGSGSEIRRARVYLKGKYKDWQYHFQTEFAGDDSSKSTYIKYTGLKDFNILIGKHSEPIGLENLNSSKHISPIERTLTGSAFFAGDRELGVSVESHGHDYSYQVGVYDIGSNATDTNLALTARLTHTPIKHEKSLLHFGMSFSHRQLDESSAFKVKSRAGIHATSIKSISSEALFVQKSKVYNLESSYIFEQWNIVGEYLIAKLAGVSSDDYRHYSSYYLQTGLFLSQDQRSYDASSGTFSGVSPNSDMGAWELFVRGENVDLSDNKIGSNAKIVTIGLNWFATKYTRLSVNYITSDIVQLNTDSNKQSIDGRALSLRMQVHW